MRADASARLFHVPAAYGTNIDYLQCALSACRRPLGMQGAGMLAQLACAGSPARSRTAEASFEDMPASGAGTAGAGTLSSAHADPSAAESAGDAGIGTAPLCPEGLEPETIGLAGRIAGIWRMGSAACPAPTAGRAGYRTIDGSNGSPVEYARRIRGRAAGPAGQPEGGAA